MASAYTLASRVEDPSSKPKGPRSALERAARVLEGTEGTPWDSDSRLGPIGRATRGAMHRALRPFEFRQRELDAAILDAVGALAGEVEAGGGGAALDLAAALDAETVVEKETRVGPLWLRADDRLITPQIVEHGLWALETSAFLVRRLRAGSTFVDVGANVGYFGVLASPLVGARGRVFAVEPDPANLPLLRANLWRNGCVNARVLPVAAWDERTHLSLMLQPEGGAGSWVTPDPESKSLHER